MRRLYFLPTDTRPSAVFRELRITPTSVDYTYRKRRAEEREKKNCVVEEVTGMREAGEMAVEWKIDVGIREGLLGWEEHGTEEALRVIRELEEGRKDGGNFDGLHRWEHVRIKEDHEECLHMMRPI
jgi:hypothetical protein